MNDQDSIKFAKKYIDNNLSKLFNKDQVKKLKQGLQGGGGKNLSCFNGSFTALLLWSAL